MLDRYDVQCRVAAPPPAPSPERRRAQARLARLRELYIDGEMTRAEYDCRAAPLRAALATPETTQSDVLDDTLPARWQEVYDALSAEGKRLFWKRVVRRIDIKKDQPPLVGFFDAPLVDNPQNGTARIV